MASRRITHLFHGQIVVLALLPREREGGFFMWLFELILIIFDIRYYKFINVLLRY